MYNSPYGYGFTKFNFEMPVYNPNFRSKIPVLKPDPAIKYHMPIKDFHDKDDGKR